MKAAIIILGNTWVCPYVNTYKHILDKKGCAYDVILWDRDGSDADAKFAFSAENANLDNPLVKAACYVRYARFIRRVVRENKYDRLVISGPHLAILLSSFLRKGYKGRYLVDYRDISIEQKPFLYGIYSKVLADSYCNVISSPGFIKYLPGKYEYLLSHNFDIEKAVNSLVAEMPAFEPDVPLKVLTIGAIRNFESNVRVLESLGNNDAYRLSFVGRGEASGRLKEYALLHNVRNVEFAGYYKKEDEVAIVNECSFINIVFPNDIKHSVIMSNRFYLALVHKKPVLVTAGSTQAALVEKYALGVVVSDCKEIDAGIRKYLSEFDYCEFCKRCNSLLSVFIEDYNALERAVGEFVRE